MINSNVNALGIIFPNSYDSMVSDLVTERSMASIPFAGRYRMVDFILSSMVNCGIDNISLIVRKNYHSLMDHLGSGREWDLTRKNGGLNIVPPYAEKSVKIYDGRVEALASILTFLKSQKEKYVVMADTNIAVNFDFKALIDAHVASGADVTMVYAEQELPVAMREAPTESRDMYYTLDLDGDKVQRIRINSSMEGVRNVSMNIFIMDREQLIDQIGVAYVHGYIYFERDVLAHQLDKLDVRAYKYDGYFARISSMKSYFDENMKLLQDENLDGLFSPSPIYTGKGAKVKNCVLMQDTVVEDGAEVEYVITDKKVQISAGKEMKGTDTYPVFVAKNKRV